jgi:hypothetical protein
MVAHGEVLAGRRWDLVNAVDRVTMWLTTLAVVGVAAVVSHARESALMRVHG